MRMKLLALSFTGGPCSNIRRPVCLHATHSSKLQLLVPTSEDMEDLGGILASMTVCSDDVAFARGKKIFLMGDLGAGKTAFARGFLRVATGIADLRVTSPTYLLTNTYQAAMNPSIEIHHIDLYRLSGASDSEFAPLNLANVFSSCVSLLEWPTRLPKDLVPQDGRLDVEIRIAEKWKGHPDFCDDEVARKLSLDSDDELWVMKIQQMRDDGLIDDMLMD